MEANSEVIVVGAGAAGLLAAISAAESGLNTIVLEKNSKPGVKILMSGGTRCNVTQDTDHRGIIDAFGPQGRFLRTAIGRFGPTDIVEFLAAEGVATKTELTGKVFPESNRAADVLDAILRRLSRTNALLKTNTPISRIEYHEESELFVVKSDSDQFTARNIILTTGGMSYPGCGTTGDGYVWAKDFGHRIVPPRPALVPLKVLDDDVTSLRGITLPDVSLRVVSTTDELRKTICQTRDSLLFTHLGISGPSVLDASRAVTTSNLPLSDMCVELDLLPATTDLDVFESVRQSDVNSGKRPVASIVSDLIPKRLASLLLVRCDVPSHKNLAELSRSQRLKLMSAMRGLCLTISGTLGFKKAEVTAGGVSLDSVDPKTMCSKHQSGLYFAGEILDVDGPIGGYNFQAAFSTGWLAGKSIVRE